MIILIILILLILTIFFLKFNRKEFFLPGLSQLYAEDQPFTYINPKIKIFYTEYPQNKFTNYNFYYPWGYYPYYYPWK